MQSIGDLFANNKILFVALLVIVLAVVGGIVALVSRALAGRRINTGANGRTRQPRLGVVDAFDLDRQRQLVIVRRDNVEHLLMIGGPNDLVIETSIVRAASAAAPLPSRDKETGIPTVLPPAMPAPSLSVPPLPGSPPPLVGDEGGLSADGKSDDDPGAPSPGPVPLPMPDAAQGSAAPPARVAPQVTMPPRPASPFPPRPQLGTAPGPKPALQPPRPIVTPVPRPPVPQTRPPGGGFTPVRAPLEPKRPEEPPRPVLPPLADATPDGAPSPAVATEPAGPPKAPLPALRNPRIETVRTDAVRAEPVAAAKPLPPANRPVPPAPVPEIKSLDGLASLEEEMAKLLGRPIPPADKS